MVNFHTIRLTVECPNNNCYVQWVNCMIRLICRYRLASRPCMATTFHNDVKLMNCNFRLYLHFQFQFDFFIQCSILRNHSIKLWSSKFRQQSILFRNFNQFCFHYNYRILTIATDILSYLFVKINDEIF